VQLVDGQMCVWKRSTMSKTTSSMSRCPTLLVPRFRADGITIVHPTLEEIGALDKKAADGILELQKSATSVRFEIYTSRGIQQDLSVRDPVHLPLDILVYGQRHSLDHVGSLLSQCGLFLQEPTRYRLCVPYINPHVLSWDDDPESSYLLGPPPEGQIFLTNEINAILEDENPATRLYFDVEQDPRIQTTLQP
jgi:hypothetical protein